MTPEDREAQVIQQARRAKALLTKRSLAARALESALLAALAESALTTQALTERTGVPKALVYAALYRLEKLGSLRVSQGAGTTRKTWAVPA